MTEIQNQGNGHNNCFALLPITSLHYLRPDTTAITSTVAVIAALAYD